MWSVNAMKEIWQNINRRGTQGFLQWKRGLTRAWRWISCSQGHCEHCRRMPPSLQQAHHHPPEDSPFQHHSGQWYKHTPQRQNMTTKKKKIYDEPQNRPNTEEGHSCCARKLECKSGQGCFWKLERYLRTLLQRRNKWERELILLEVATSDDLVLVNNFRHHKAFRRWTWHSQNGQHHNQIDYILVRRRFRSGEKIARTRSFFFFFFRSRHCK